MPGTSLRGGCLTVKVSPAPSSPANDRSQTARPHPKKPSVLSLFTGAGGLDIGLEKAGFKLVGLVEQDSDCRETLKRNRRGWRQLDPGDIFEHTPEEILEAFKVKPRELTLVAGGPPCQ